MKNKKTFVLISVIIVIILAVAGLFVFNWHQNNINKTKPVITSISPTAVVAGTSSFELRVYGHNLKADSVINLNTAPITTDSKFVSYGFLRATIDASRLANSGEYSVTVSNLTPYKVTSNSVPFQVMTTLQTK